MKMKQWTHTQKAPKCKVKIAERTWKGSLQFLALQLPSA